MISTFFAALLMLTIGMNGPVVDQLDHTIRGPIDIAVSQPNLAVQAKALVGFETVLLVLNGTEPKAAQQFFDHMLALVDSQEESKALLETKKSQLQWDLGNIFRLNYYGIKQRI